MPSRRCGCASDECSCVIQSGTGVDVSGSGTKNNPYVIDASIPVASLTVQDENTVVRSGVDTLDFTGAGVSATPGAAGEVVVTVSPGLLGVNVTTQVFTADGTWTKPANLLYVVVEVQGGGGGSGGCSATAASENAAGSGGGGGGYSKKTIPASALGASVAVTVGAGGTGATAGGSTVGGTGGTSSFGSQCSATGGNGGNSGNSGSGTTAGALGGTGGTGSNGELNVAGQQGGYGHLIGGIRVLSAVGGSSQLGEGGQPAHAAVGNPGVAYGGGAGGSCSNPSTAARTGAAGAPGIVLVTSYVKT